jgi:hypothetical protein
MKAAIVDDRGLHGTVIGTDGPFGNLMTNISAEDFSKLGYQRGQDVRVRIGGREMTINFVKTFSDVPVGQPLLYIDSRGRLAMAVNQNNFAATYGVKVPSKIEIPRAK